MLALVEPTVAAAERDAANAPLEKVLDRLRDLCLDDFGALLLSLPNTAYPNLSWELPRMAATETQQAWTGSDGFTLLRQTLNFARILSHKYAETRNQALAGKKILDFGCGYGRILRVMSYFSNPTHLYGCDPWNRSIELCRSDGVLGHLAQSEYLPNRLPFEEETFDVIYGFSVFTHLSGRSCRASFSALRQHIAEDGLLAITIRPVEYWRYAEEQGIIPPGAAAPMERSHSEDGFAFRPHDREPVDGDITYGETSITLDYIGNQFKEWAVLGYEHTYDDYHQVIVFLEPR